MPLTEGSRRAVRNTTRFLNSRGSVSQALSAGLQCFGATYNAPTFIVEFDTQTPAAVSQPTADQRDAISLLYWNGSAWVSVAAAAVNLTGPTTDGESFSVEFTVAANPTARMWAVNFEGPPSDTLSLQKWCRPVNGAVFSRIEVAAVGIGRNGLMGIGTP